MATVRSLNATLEANTTQFQSAMAAARAATEGLAKPLGDVVPAARGAGDAATGLAAVFARITDPARETSRATREIQFGLRALAVEAIGIPGPLGRIAAGFSTMYLPIFLATAAIGGLIAALRFIDKPWADLDKRLEAVNKRFKEQGDQFAEYSAIAREAAEHAKAVVAATEQIRPLRGDPLMPGAAAMETLTEQAAQRRGEEIQTKALTDRQNALNTTQREYLTQLVQRGSLIGQDIGTTAALVAAYKNYDKATQDMAASIARENAVKEYGVELDHQRLQLAMMTMTPGQRAAALAKEAGASPDQQREAARVATQRAATQVFLDNQEAVKKTVAAMNEYIATLGQGQLQARRWQIVHSSMNAEQRQTALAAIDSAIAYQTFYDRVEQAYKAADDMARAIAAQKNAVNDSVQSLKTQVETFGMTRGEIELYRLQLQLGALANTQFGRDAMATATALSQQLDALEAVRKAQEADRQAAEKASKEQERLWQHTVNSMSDAFAQMLVDIGNTKQAFSDMVQSMIQMWQRLAAQLLAQQLFSLILGGGGGGISPTLGGFPDIGNAGAGMDASGYFPTKPRGMVAGGPGAGLMVVHQSVNFQVSAMDHRSVVTMIQEHKDTIAAVVLKATQQSASYRAALARG